MNEVHSPKKPLIFYYMVAMLLVMLFNFIAMPWLSQYQIQEVDYNTFVDMTEKGEIGRAEIQEADNRILFTSKDEKAIYKTAMISSDSQLVQRLLDAGVSTSGEEIEQTSLLMNILSWVAPILIFIALGQFMSRKLMQKMGGGNSMMFNMGKSNAKVYVKSAEGIRFDDVAGEDEAKENLTEIVNYLHDPSKYQEIGASMPKGVLLVGPPGTGKTMLAKAVAGEANVPFFSMSGSEFVEMFVGMGASKVRDLFKQAKEKAPCIVFIDEIDAIGKKRDGQIGGNDEREQTLNQLLTEMDGFEGNTGVIILAATNRPESLDPALTRPGRFDRRVPVELPDLKGREEILKVHAKKIKVAEDVDFNKVARMASGASGAELANIVNEAALRAVRDGRKFATQADLEESIEVVIAGYQKKNAIMTDHEKRIVAYHEIGHALVAAKQTNSAPVQKITIVPRTSGALGYTMQVDEGNHVLMSKEEIENKIATFTGGRAAEEVVFGSVTTGASNDIEQATKLARAMITRYGMSDDFDMVALETVTNQYLGGDASLACSAETQTRIDQQVVALVKREHQKALNILRENRTKLDELANIVNEAALRAVRDGRRFAAQADLEESIEVVIAGYQKKNAILTDQEKKVVAYHEIGHALVAAKQTNSAPVQKITIVPRTSGALGYTMQVEEGNHYLMSQEELENKIATLTGGRAAEELVFHSASTGASNDIEQATKLARAMITRYGMSPDFDMVALETVQNQYLGGDASLACSAETAAEIDRQVVELVKRQHEKANRILSENREKLDELARYLYEKETITGDEFMEILNQ